ncbi:MAG: hypothetical protein CMQ07_04555 [Gammaproteobacteria bacterium]|nr:hypothetical protein [Gammaproteobacteria bacterium]|tara:strand:+ start:690 stop:1481 length:792 start_codon:yes stop_codon:yes gene_type:complete
MRGRRNQNVLVVGSGEIAHSLLSQNPGWSSVRHSGVSATKFDNFNCVINASFDPCYLDSDMNSSLSFDADLASRCLHAKYIFLSTRLVYQPGLNLHEDAETVKVANQNAEIYGLNKLAMEREITSRHNNALILRLPNVISQRTSTNRYWGRLTESAKQGFVSLDVSSSGIRDFLYARDLALMLSELIGENATGIFNIAYPEKMPAEKLVLELRKYFPIKSVTYAPDNTHQYSLDSTKLGAVIDLRRFSLSSALKQILEETCTL